LSLISMRPARFYLNNCLAILNRTSNQTSSPKGATPYHDIEHAAHAWNVRLAILHDTWTPESTNAKSLGLRSVPALSQENVVHSMTVWLEKIANCLMAIDFDASSPSVKLNDLFHLRKEYKKWWLAWPWSDTPVIQLDRRLLDVHLYHYLNLVFMGRHFIFKAGETETTDGYSNPIPDDVCELFSAESEYGAYAIIDICSMLDRCYSISASSYIESTASHAAMMVMLARSVRGRCHLFREKFDRGMSLLKKVASSCHLSREHMDAERLDLAIQHAHMHTSPPIPSHDQQSTPKQDYSRFKAWANQASRSKDDISMTPLAPPDALFYKHFDWSFLDSPSLNIDELWLGNGYDVLDCTQPSITVPV
jgi:hypothetical protein